MNTINKIMREVGFNQNKVTLREAFSRAEYKPEFVKLSEDNQFVITSMILGEDESKYAHILEGLSKSFSPTAIIVKRFKALGLMDKFTNRAIIASEAYCHTTPGSIVIFMIDILSKFKDKEDKITHLDIIDAYPDGYYSIQSINEIATTFVMNKSVLYNELY